MKLYLISQSIVSGYDTYDAAIVSAEDEDDARNIHPSDFVTHIANGMWMGSYSANGEAYECEYMDSWPSYRDISHVKVEYLGETSRKRGVVLSSFNAG